MSLSRIRPSSPLCLCILLPTLLALPSASASVKVWEQAVVIPTYEAGPPEVNPMFYFGRTSQGAEGRVYPYPLYDNLTGNKADKTYQMVYLENEYVRIGVLPEVGGRIFEAVDKTNGYNFFYRQHVIKPALIGLIGAWISGGVEWNIPHHHRASTFIPVQHRIEENADGSKTVWVGELEVRHRMRWAVGYTLRPGKSVLEASLRIVNRTPVVNTMLCFANAAVHVNDDYQVIFPPSTQFVTHHSKREFTTWPIATTWYGGADFTKGVDVSWYKNHDSANSMFAWNYEDDFFAGYDHGKEAGTLSVADHHIVPGKKLWTWGNGQRGRMWDKILTDEDGPYIELMVGAYSDNQPDYSWLFPYEVKSFSMYWYPFRSIGGVKNANLDAAVNLDVNEGTATVGFCTTSAYRSATATLRAKGRTLLEEKIAIDPGRPYQARVSVPNDVNQYDLTASLSSAGSELAAYTPVRLKKEKMPEPVTNPAEPAKIATVEELYLTGLRIEQFHNPTLDPDPYWEEALRRDPCDVRVNTALAINCIKKARFADAERLCRNALERLTAKYTTPKDAEPQYYLGLALKAQGRNDEAYEVFYKATWNAPWRAASYYSLAEIACSRLDWKTSLDLVDRSLEANGLNVRALTLKAAVLRHRGQPTEALKVLDLAAAKADPLDARIMMERWLAAKAATARRDLLATFRDHPVTALETMAEYGDAGLWEDGSATFLVLAEATPERSRLSPLAHYYLADFAERLGEKDRARLYRKQAMSAPCDYAFPFQWEMISVLRRAVEANPQDGMAPYYLADLLFDWQPEEAIRLWEWSVAINPTFAIAYRNLGVAYSHQKAGDSQAKAIACLEKAVSLPTRYAIHFTELDELYEAAATDPAKRLALLEANQQVVQQRDDSLSRMIGLKVLAGKHDEAIRLMTGRSFEVWEGGSLTVAESWTDAHVLRAARRVAGGQHKEALADLNAAGKIPDNLPSERRVGGRDAEVAYWTGMAYEGLGDKDKARQAWTQGSSAPSGEAGQGGPRRRLGGRGGFGPGPESYWQALCLRKLGEEQKATDVFAQLVKTGTDRLQQSSDPNSPAPFGRQQSQRSRAAGAHYLAGLGYLGQGDKAKAKEELTLALQSSPDHLGAKAALEQID
jgi:tetratricopeptide (TPR) repeat protein